MTQPQQLWILAGGNGSGKSTFYRLFLAPRGLPFVNADLIAKQLFPHAPEEHSYSAAKLAEQQRNLLLEDGASFCYETVFSHASKIDFLGQAKARGYEIILVFIHLNNTELNQARISQRVSEGGHNVPDDKVISRIPRTLDNIRAAIDLCDQVWLLDNSSIDHPFQQVATANNGQIQHLTNPLPDWAKYLLRG